MDTPRPAGQDEEANPYAPPRAALAGGNAQPAPSSRPRFSVEDVARFSWSLYRARFTHCVSVFWGVFTINWLCQMSIAYVDQVIASLRDPTFERLSQFITLFAGIVVAVWLTIGQNRAFLKIARGGAVAIEDIFAGGRFVLTTILAGIVFVAILAVPLLLLDVLARGMLDMLVAGPSLAAVLGFLAGSLASIAAIFYLWVRLGFFMYVVIDQNAGVFSSLALAWQLCGRHLATMILVYLLWLTVNLAGCLLFCVGLIFTLPFASLILAVTYHYLTGWGGVFRQSTLDTED